MIKNPIVEAKNIKSNMRSLPSYFVLGFPVDR